MPQTYINFFDERGQTMTEYALIVSLVALIVIAAFPAIVTSLHGFFSSVGTALGVGG